MSTTICLHYNRLTVFVWLSLCMAYITGDEHGNSVSTNITAYSAQTKHISTFFYSVIVFEAEM